MRGGQDLSTFALEVLRAEGQEEVEVLLPETAVVAGAPRRVLLLSAHVEIARATLRSLRSAVRDALDIHERHQLSSAEEADFAVLVDSLRRILEGLFKQPLALLGEEREEATTLTVKQTVNHVRGTLTGIRAPWARGLAGGVEQKIKVIEHGGSVVGIDLTP
ncbi:hypothetical protein [Nonomuraea sp. NPDC052265]|uniref:hypothetical protein n=1 Tax=Nonomuraea sp. NPDC052265 TaxID=3364374 RepID=UPI0037CC9A5B